jgi:inorganic pyrophosphatase
MEDDGGGDEKIIAVPSPKLTQRYAHVETHTDLPRITLEQIQHFFEHYKDLRTRQVGEGAGLGRGRGSEAADHGSDRAGAEARRDFKVLDLYSFIWWLERGAAPDARQ